LSTASSHATPGTTTPFGRHADPLADTAFWTWFTFTDPGRGSRTVQTAVALTWLAPILSVTATSIARGHMIEPPRPRWIRPAVTLQLLLATHELQRRHISPATRTPEDGYGPSRQDST